MAPQITFNYPDFSYQITSYEHYYSEQFISKWNFNKQIEKELNENKYIKILPEEKQLKFVGAEYVKTIQGCTPLQLNFTPLEFFNLFYHELDYILENKSKPLSIAPRLNSITMYFHNKLYFLLKLIELLKSENDQQLLFIATEIEEQYNQIFTQFFSKNNNANKTALENINFYNNYLNTIGSIREKLTLNHTMKHLQIVLILILTCFNLFGQVQKYQSMSDNELRLLSDLNNLRCNSEAIAYPYITSSIELNISDIHWISSEYGFTIKQLTQKTIDTLLLKNNHYFEVIEADSIFKYSKIFSISITKDTILLDPYYFYLKQLYNKTYTRYFSKPIISRNRAFAIVEYEDICGNLCAYSEILIMQNRKGKWKIIKVIGYSMS